MQHTLIAVFDNPAAAQAAKDALAAAGFTDAAIRQDGAAAHSATHSATHVSLGAGIRHFFADLFAHEDSAHSRRYDAALARGQHVLTLVGVSEREIERAADIVEQHGHVDIDEETGSRFVTGGQGAGMAATAGAQQKAGEHTLLPAIEEALRSGKQAVQRSGVRIFRRLREAPDGGTTAAAYRAHYDSVYAGSEGVGGRSFDDYLPAYGYGADMAGSDAYRGRAWDDIEMDLRRDWDARHPGAAWEHFKAAVRHGWEQGGGGRTG